MQSWALQFDLWTVTSSTSVFLFCSSIHLEIPVLSFPHCAEFGLHGSVLTTDFIILFSFIITKNQCQPIKKRELSASPSLLLISKLNIDTTFYINQNNFSFRCSNSYGSFLCYPLTLRCCWVVHFQLQYLKASMQQEQLQCSIQLTDYCLLRYVSTLLLVPVISHFFFCFIPGFFSLVMGTSQFVGL